MTADRYMPGYTPRVLSLMTRRSADEHAAFFLPYFLPGMSVLDCGCGPGNITRGLAESVAPGEVIGVDLDASQIELAQANKDNSANLTFVQAGVYALPFPDGHFDAVFSHALFEHIAEPVRAAREIHRVLKPGGVVGLCSPDWGGFIFAPEYPEIEAASTLFRRLQESHGGNTTAGRRLGGWLTEAGFKHVRPAARYECDDDLSIISGFLRDRLERAPREDNVFARGWTTLEALDGMLRALREWETRADGLCAIAWLSALARK